MLIFANIVFSNYAGSDCLALIAEIGDIYTMFHMSIVGINQGIIPIIGYNWGAKHTKSVITTAKSAIIFSTIISIVGFIAVFFFNEEIMSFFASGEQQFFIEYWSKRT